MKCKACGNLIDYSEESEYCDIECMKLQREYLEGELRELEHLINKDLLTQ